MRRTLMAKMTPEELAARIDHTLLKPDATKAEIERLCQEGVENGFAAVVVNSTWVPYCAATLSDVKVEQDDEQERRSILDSLAPSVPIGLCSVVSFPLGADSDTVKCFAAEDAVRKGATEIDVVANIGMVKDGLWDDIEEEIAGIRDGIDKFAMGARPVLKVIIEASLLTEDEITMVSQRVVAGGADFVKTDSGFVGEGAKPETVKLISAAIGSTAKVKASGGIRTLEQALVLIDMGADRLGTSAAMDILAEAKAKA